MNRRDLLRAGRAHISTDHVGAVTALDAEEMRLQAGRDADARAYRDRIRAALPEGQAFTPLMTLYLTETTDPEDVAAAAASGLVSAVKLYPPLLRDRGTVWPVSHVVDTTDQAALAVALRQGRYGECVYRGANDVVDHQVIAMRLSGGITATFTMTAFTEQTHRQTRIHGSHGWLRGDGPVELTLRELSNVMSKHGITTISPAVGDQFDPQLHQAMFEAPLPGTRAGDIIQVATQGFMLHDRLLRAAQVGVSSMPAS